MKLKRKVNLPKEIKKNKKNKNQIGQNHIFEVEIER